MKLRERKLQLTSECEGFDDGGLRAAGMQATSILLFNKIYQNVLKELTDNENWQKATEVPTDADSGVHV